MRLCLELTAVCRPVRTGIAHYAWNLARALVAENADSEAADTFESVYRLSRWRRRHLRMNLPGVRRGWVQEPWWPPRPRYDVVHGLDGRVPNWRGMAKVVTVHDLFALHPQADTSGSARDRAVARCRRVARISDRVICPSEATRADFIARSDMAPDRVHAVHLGVDPDFTAPPPDTLGRWRREQGFEHPYILFVGEFGSRKNLARLLQAYILSGLSVDYELVYVGYDPESMRAELTRIAERGSAAGRVRFPGYITGGDLYSLYAAASAFAFPSLFEGFGLPVLEAMACGAPVLTSNLGATAEIGRGHAVLVDPYSEEDIAAGLIRAVNLTTQARQAATLYARGYTWRATARKTREVYLKALKQS